MIDLQDEDDGEAEELRIAREQEFDALDVHMPVDEAQVYAGTVPGSPAPLEGHSDIEFEIETRGIVRPPSLHPPLTETPARKPRTRYIATLEELLRDVGIASESVNVENLVFEVWWKDELDPVLVEAGKDKEKDNLQYFSVYKWIRIEDMPGDATIRDCVWVMKKKGYEVRARLCYRDFANVKRDDVHAPTPTQTEIRVVFLHGTYHDNDVWIGDLLSAFMHAFPKSENMFARPPPDMAVDGWIWQLLRAMNGMRTASQDFFHFFQGICVKKLALENLRASPCLFVSSDRRLLLASHVDDPIASGKGPQLARLWKELQKWVLLREGILIGEDSPVCYLGLEFLVTT